VKVAACATFPFMKKKKTDEHTIEQNTFPIERSSHFLSLL